MKKLILALIFLLSVWSSLIHNVSAEEWEIKIRIYWHVYDEDKNNPIKNISVFIKKDWKILGNWKTNKEWLYDIVIDNRTDYLNLCIESNSFTEISTIKYCVTVSAFQWISRTIQDIEIREVEYDFFTNKKWYNLNQRYEDEITNKKTEEDFEEYQDIILQEREDEAVKEAEEVKRIELEKLKAEYNMVSNTEMTGPLEAIQIIWTVKTLNWNNKDLDYNRTYIIVLDHFWNKIKEERLNKYYDYNITVTPRENKVFLHPVNLKIESREYHKVEGENIMIYEPQYKLITKEKNVVNIKLKKKEISKIDKTTYIKEGFPFFTIIFIISFILIVIILIVQNKIHSKREDY